MIIVIVHWDFRWEPVSKALTKLSGRILSTQWDVRMPRDRSGSVFGLFPVMCRMAMATRWRWNMTFLEWRTWSRDTLWIGRTIYTITIYYILSYNLCYYSMASDGLEPACFIGAVLMPSSFVSCRTSPPFAMLLRVYPWGIHQGSRATRCLSGGE